MCAMSHKKQRAHAFRRRRHPLEIDHARIGAGARDYHLRLVFAASRSISS
jgi:hypothetical protein